MAKITPDHLARSAFAGLADLCQILPFSLFERKRSNGVVADVETLDNLHSP